MKKKKDIILTTFSFMCLYNAAYLIIFIFVLIEDVIHLKKT